MKRLFFFFLPVLFLAGSCVVTRPPEISGFKSSFNDIRSFTKKKSSIAVEPYLKAHLASGGLIIFTDTSWNYNHERKQITGNGKSYDMHRDLLSQGVIVLGVDSVLLFESNQKLDLENRKSRIATHTILTVVDATMGVICLSVPKACWGSCPTFYTDPEGDVFQADAEGFSEAIIPSLEYGDIDALTGFNPQTKDFSILMKNEALETHVVRKVKILAVEKDPNLLVYHGNNDKFWLSDPVMSKKPLEAIAAEGDITRLLLELDRSERFSFSDPRDMKSREELILTFEHPGGRNNAGLVLNFRQTLMTTYLIYNALGYMGNMVGDVLSEVEKMPAYMKRFKLIEEELGGIDVYLLEDGVEKYCGKFLETGPIASNQQTMVIEDLPDEAEVKIKLVMNKGLWRIDQALLVPLIGEIEPLELEVNSLEYKSKKDDELLSSLRSDEGQLVSMPGDEYILNFSLPEGEENYDLFLYSQGYYLEWMRESWLKDRNMLKLRMLLENPDKFFRKEARRYSRYESQMEEIFWSSRIDTDKYDYFESSGNSE